jgi:hypothetical protein
VEERTKTLETKKREKNFGCDEESVKKRRWERKRRRGKKMLCEPERENERGERKKDKIRIKAVTVNFHIAYFG